MLLKFNEKLVLKVKIAGGSRGGYPAPAAGGEIAPVVCRQTRPRVVETGKLFCHESLEIGVGQNHSDCSRVSRRDSGASWRSRRSPSDLAG